MRKKILYSVLACFMLLNACRKEDNPKIPVLARVPVPSVTKDASGAGTIVVSDLANFTGKVKVDVLFKTDIPPKKMDLVITKNGVKSSVKVLMADITTFPTTVSFTGPQLTTLFGSVQTCDFFDVGVNVTTQDGTLYEAFPAVGSAYGAGVAGQYGGVTTSLNYSTKVEYTPDVYQGDFEVVTDDFAELAPGDVLTLTKINDSSFSFLYIHPELSDPLPVIVSVNTSNNAIKILKQKVGSDFYGYSNPNFEATGAADNAVAPCDKTVTLNITYTVDAGSFGSAILVLKKK